MALDHYDDISKDDKQIILDKLGKRVYDDLVEIKRDSIDGSSSYDPELHQMHFKEVTICQNVDRSKWSAKASQRAYVYCANDNACIIVPVICGNVSRITRRPSGGGGGGSGGRVVPTFVSAVQPATVYPQVPYHQEELLSWIQYHEPSFVTLPVQTGIFADDDGGWIGDPHWCPPHIPTTPVPEPETWIMVLIGLLIMWLVMKRK